MSSRPARPPHSWSPTRQVPLTSSFPSGARGRLTLTPGMTNVLTMTTADLANLSEITYLNPPTASTPLLINVVGDPFKGQIPNQAGDRRQPGAVHPLELPGGADHQGDRRRLHRGHDLRTARDPDLGAHPEHRGQRHREHLQPRKPEPGPGSAS